MPKGSDLLVAALENEGVDRIFGVPGEENLDVVESLRNSSIKLILTRHEQGAAFMAATYGRLTGKPGVCITTLGPGALNLTTGAAYALLGGMPMIMLTGQKGIMSSRQAKFQIVDVVGTFKPLTKLSLQIVSTSSIPTIVRDAFRIAMEERPGPVLLELPEDVAGQEAIDHAWCRCVPPAEHVGDWRLCPPHANSVLYDANGQGNSRRWKQVIHGNNRAQRARLRSRRSRSRRSDYGHRPRYDREAALHHGPERPASDPCQLHARQRGAGLFSAMRGGWRCRPEPGTAG